MANIYYTMNKYLFLLCIPILSFFTLSCNREDDVTPIDLNLFADTWQVVNPGGQNIFGYDEILHITSAQIHEGFGGYQGYIATYLLRYDDTPVHDRVFTWSIREVENHQPLLDVVYQGELDSDDLWAGNYPYKIIKLTDSHMWWQVNTNGDNSVIMFKRRNDIHIE